MKAMPFPFKPVSTSHGAALALKTTGGDTTRARSDFGALLDAAAPGKHDIPEVKPHSFVKATIPSPTPEVADAQPAPVPSFLPGSIPLPALAATAFATAQQLPTCNVGAATPSDVPTDPSAPTSAKTSMGDSGARLPSTRNGIVSTAPVRDGVARPAPARGGPSPSQAVASLTNEPATTVPDQTDAWLSADDASAEPLASTRVDASQDASVPIAAVSVETHLALPEATAAAQIADVLMPALDAHAPAPPQHAPASSSASAQALSSVVTPAREKLQTLVIDLEPERLGSVQVRMRLVGDELRVGIVTQTSAAASAIDADRSHLSDRIAQAGYRLADIQIAAASAVNASNSASLHSGSDLPPRRDDASASGRGGSGNGAPPQDRQRSESNAQYPSRARQGRSGVRGDLRL